MNDWLVRWGIEGWKPALQILVIPPLPMLLLALLAVLLVRRRPGLAQALGLLAATSLWAVSTPFVGHGLVDVLTRPPPALSAERIAALKAAPHTAILVLGAGRRTDVPEYHAPDLSLLGLARLRYGAWLSRQTGLPLGYSGGIGHGGTGSLTEAQAARLAIRRDQGVAPRWAEERSRDTNENARYSVEMLQADGISQLVLVTHGFHQRRALAAFERAIARSGRPMRLVAAPMGLNPPLGPVLTDFLPGPDGLAHSRWAVHEWLGWLAGA